MTTVYTAQPLTSPSPREGGLLPAAVVGGVAGGLIAGPIGAGLGAGVGVTAAGGGGWNGNSAIAAFFGFIILVLIIWAVICIANLSWCQKRDCDDNRGNCFDWQRGFGLALGIAIIIIIIGWVFSSTCRTSC